MTAKKRPRATSPDRIPCSVHVQRGGVSIGVDHIMLSQAAEVACYILGQLEQKQATFPELERPQEVVQIGGYTPVSTEDTDTWARKDGPPRVGF